MKDGAPARPVISVMLAVPNGPAAVEWYKQALGATELWSLGPVAGLEIQGAPFFIGEPEANGWEAPVSSPTRRLRRSIRAYLAGRRQIAAPAIAVIPPAITLRLQ